jgi:N utilization substance protein A
LLKVGDDMSRDMSRIRDPKSGGTYHEYLERIGELIKGTVKRIERGEIIVDLGQEVEASVPRSQQTRTEQWRAGDRIRVVIVNAYDRKGPPVEASRNSEVLLQRLFEEEVPEIRDGTVVIKSVARVPGKTSKIAVTSTKPGVDPVMACLGPKGSRLNAIVREVRGEKIDIIEWSDDPGQLGADAGESEAKSGSSTPNFD